ncbi:hypothetical protein [Scytonema sp. PRP1]
MALFCALLGAIAQGRSTQTAMARSARLRSDRTSNILRRFP